MLHAVAEAFPAAEDHSRIYANKPLETIHSDLAVETCLHLLAEEKDERIQMQLALAVLAHFAEEGVEVARRLLLGREIDFDSRDLWDSLLETCTLTGARFPEYDEWLVRRRHKKEEHWKTVKELEGDPRRLMLYAFEKLAGKKAADVAQTLPRTPSPLASRLFLPPAPHPERSRRSAGTNDAPVGVARSSSIAAGGGSPRLRETRDWSARPG